MREEIWKHQWLQPCFARYARKIIMGRQVATLMISSVSLKPVNPPDCVWKNLYQIFMRNSRTQIFPMPQAMKILAAKAAVDKEWVKLEKISAWNLTKVRNKSEVIDEARTKGIKVHFASLMDICHLKNAELETKHQNF